MQSHWYPFVPNAARDRNQRRALPLVVVLDLEGRGRKDARIVRACYGLRRLFLRLKLMIGRGLRHGSLLWLSLSALLIEAAPLRTATAAERSAVAAQPPTAPQPAIEADSDWSSFFSTDMTVRDIDVQTWLGRLRRFGVEVPFDLAGQVTATLRVGAPRGGVFRFRSYRLAGTLSSDRLIVAGLELLDFQALLDFQNPVLRLNELRFRIESDEPRREKPVPGAGQFAGQAIMDLSPEGEVTATFRLDRVPVVPLRQFFAELPEITGGTVSGLVSLRTVAGRLRELSALQADGNVTIQRLAALERVVDSARADFRFSDRLLEVTDFRGRVSGLELTGAGRLPMQPPYSFQAEAVATVNNLADLQPLIGELPVPPLSTGIVRLSMQSRGTLEPLDWNVEGQGTGRSIQIADIPLQSVDFHYMLNEELFRVRQLLVRAFGGELAGSIDLPLAATELATADLRWKEVDLRRLVEFRPEGFPRVDGQLQGRLTAKVPVGQITSRETWNGAARIEMTHASVGRFAVPELAADALLQNGVLRVSDFRAVLAERRGGEQGAGNRDAAAPSPSGTLTGTGSLELDAPFAFRADLDAARITGDEFRVVLDVFDLPFRAEGVLTGAAQVQGTVQPPDLQGRGHITGDHLVFASSTAAAETNLFDELAIEHLDARWSAGGKQVALESLEMALYGGSARGTALFPLRSTDEGKADLSWNKVDLGRLAADLSSRWPEDLQAAAEGAARLQWGPAVGDNEWDVRVESTFRLPEIRLQTLRLGSLAGEVRYAERTFHYAVAGEALDGSIRTTGTLPLDGALEAKDQGEFQVRNVSWSTLASAANRLANVGLPEQLSARVDADATYRHGGQSTAPTGSGFVEWHHVRWADRQLLSRLQANLAMTERGISLSTSPAAFARGQLRGSLLYRFGEAGIGPWEVVVRRADAAEALSFVPAVSEWITGSLDLYLRGYFHRQVSAAGQLVVDQSRVGGVEARGIRLPVNISFDPQTGVTDFRLSQGAARVAHGRVTGSLRGTAGRTLRLDGDLNFNNVDARTLFSQLGSQSRLGRGKINGRVTLQGRNVRSIRDLGATIDVQMRDMHPDSIPVLGAIQPYLPASAPAQSVSSGELRARLSNAVLYVERFTLTGQSLHVYADGSVTTDGRLGLDVLASTGPARSDRFLAQALLNRLPALGPPPLILALEINRFLSNRVIPLRVRGTVERPIVQVRAMPLLKDEALRYLLSQLTGRNPAALPPR